jgi:hypothetical protein
MGVYTARMRALGALLTSGNAVGGGLFFVLNLRHCCWWWDAFVVGNHQRLRGAGSGVRPRKDVSRSGCCYAVGAMAVGAMIACSSLRLYSTVSLHCMSLVLLSAL